MQRESDRDPERGTETQRERDRDPEREGDRDSDTEGQSLKRRGWKFKMVEGREQERERVNETGKESGQPAEGFWSWGGFHPHLGEGLPSSAPSPAP